MLSLLLENTLLEFLQIPNVIVGLIIIGFGIKLLVKKK